MRVFEPLDIDGNDFGTGVIDEVLDKVERTHPDLVAGGDHLTEMHAAILGSEVHHRKTKAAALRHHTHRTGVIGGEKHRTKAGVDIAGSVEHALTIRTDDTHVELGCHRRQLALHLDAAATHLGITGAEYDGKAHALLATGAQHLRRPRRIDQDQREIRRLRQRLDRGITFNTEYLLILRIHRIQAASVMVRYQMVQRLSADGNQILRCTNDGDRARIEKTFEIMVHDGTGRSSRKLPPVAAKVRHGSVGGRSPQGADAGR